MKYKYTKKHKLLNRLINRAIRQYSMISEGDRLLVGLSGGKDSLSLMWLLSKIRNRMAINFELMSVYVDLGFERSFAERLIGYCKNQGYDFRVEYSNFGQIAHSCANKKKSPCFLCSLFRRRRIFEVAKRLNCRTVVLGHNKDDIIETLFLNIFYSGRIGTMLPSQKFFNDNLKIIRPLVFVNESDMIRFASEREFPEFVNSCPSVNSTKRREVKDMLNTLYGTNENIKGNIFKSLTNVKLDYLLK